MYSPRFTDKVRNNTPGNSFNSDDSEITPAYSQEDLRAIGYCERLGATCFKRVECEVQLDNLWKRQIDLMDQKFSARGLGHILINKIYGIPNPIKVELEKVGQQIDLVKHQLAVNCNNNGSNSCIIDETIEAQRLYGPGLV